MTDCLLVGFYDVDFPAYVDLVRRMGTDDGTYRDLDLAFVRLQGTPARALDVLTRLGLPDPLGDDRPYHNADFLWPAVTYLGSYLHRHGFTFDYVNTPHLEWERFAAKLAEGPRTVAITTTVYVSPLPIVQLVQFVRRHAPRTRVIVGGPYIANQSALCSEADLQRLLRYLDADVYVISHEGEHTLTQVLGALDGGDLDGVGNLAYRDGDAYRFTPAHTERNPLDSNAVDYGLFPSADLGEFVSLRTARSCPFACSFCGFPARAGRYTYLGVDLVERELDALAARGITTVTFLDDTFNVPPRRFKDLLRMMIRNDYGFRWNSFYRADHGDAETIELMAASGCEGVFLGVESGSDRILAAMNKTARRADYLAAVPQLRRAGIVTHANVIVGFPGETPDSVRETEDLLSQARPDFYRAQLWYADPATPVWERRAEFGIHGSGFRWRHHTMSAEEAAGWVDRMMLSVGGSTWLPQNGFELWSVFYLQRRGFSLADVRRFVTCFDRAVAEKLLDDTDAAASPALERALTAAARPARRPPSGTGQDAVAALSSRRYLDAERWWYAALGVPSPAQPQGRVHDAGRAGAWAWDSVPVAVEPDLLDDAARAWGATPAGSALAAFAIATAGITGDPGVRLLAGRSSPAGAGFGPVRLDANRPPAALGAAAAHHFTAAATHARFAPRLLGGWFRRRGGREGAAGCGAWFAWHDGAAAPGGWAASLRDAVDPSEGPGLGLEIVTRGTTLDVRVWAVADRSDAAPQRLASAWLAVMAAAHSSDEPVARAAVGAHRRHDAGERFHF